MEGRPRRHCPHLGLKHTKAIRFSSPTEEHRCYIFGDPLPIEVDQHGYCLSEGYIRCPRFIGKEPPPVAAAANRSANRAREATPRRPRQPRPPSALTRFWQQLSPRDRILYLSLIGFLCIILAAYGVIIGIVLPARSHLTPTAVPTTTFEPEPSLPVVVATGTPQPTGGTIRPVTREPTIPPQATATRLIVAPTTVAGATRAPTETPVPPTAVTASPTDVPPTTVATTVATAVPTAVATTVPPTATPVIVPPTATVPPPPTSSPSEWSTLYFLGPNKAYYVPVSRWHEATDRMAQRALEEMIAGPRAGSGLLRSIPEGMGLNSVRIEGGVLYADFDSSFEALGAGYEEAMAVVLAMTEFSTVQQVQFLVNGTPVGMPGSGGTDPVGRPRYVNYENPDNLDPSESVALLLYLATPDRQHLFPLVRPVPYDPGTARRTIEEIIEGPTAAYIGLAVSPLPGNLGIQTIYRGGDAIIYVNFDSAFWDAPDQELAIQSLALAMTSLTADSPQGIVAVQISVEGGLVGVYYRPRMNPE